jgi:hypothetical protein
MFWRTDRANNSWRSTRGRQGASPPLAGSLHPDAGGPLAATGTVEAYLAFVRAEYESLESTTGLDEAQLPIAAISKPS